MTFFQKSKKNKKKIVKKYFRTKVEGENSQHGGKNQQTNQSSSLGQIEKEATNIDENSKDKSLCKQTEQELSPEGKHEAASKKRKVAEKGVSLGAGSKSRKQLIDSCLSEACKRARVDNSPVDKRFRSVPSAEINSRGTKRLFHHVVQKTCKTTRTF